MLDQSPNSSATFKLVFSAGRQNHGATSDFLFSNDTSYPLANNKTIAEIMTSYWISFVVAGDPNPLRSGKAAFWQSYKGGGNGGGEGGEGTDVGFNVLQVSTSAVAVRADPDASAKCDFFAGRGRVLMN
jgi:hypothetical protein